MAYSPFLRTWNAYVISVGKFIPCIPVPTCNTNGTVVVKLTTGPEDPRIFHYNGVEYLSFFSYDNIVDSQNNNTVLSQDYVGSY